MSFPGSLKIGEVGVAPATVLAPMAGVTDTVFRRFIRGLGGCGLIMTEFTSSHGVVGSSRSRKPGRTLDYLAFEPDEHPISAQLFGSDPEVMADAARVCQDLGFDIVDINLGCPVKKVVRCNGGSGLLRDLPLVERILRGVRAAVSIPLTIKFRVGLERAGDCGRAAGAAGRGLRRGCHRSAPAHARAGLQRPGRLEPHRRSQGGRADSGDRQRRYRDAGRRRPHGAARPAATPS